MSTAVTLYNAPLFTPTPTATRRTVEFFTARVRNAHTRKAYLNAACRFSAWCAAHGLTELGAIEAFHVAAYIRELQAELAAPTVKQHLAALRALLDELVTAGVLPFNPAHAVRGPRHVVKRGKTPVLTPEETRALLDSIELTPLGLRDRALIGVMVYTFARIGAVLGMRVRDYYIEQRRGWVRLQEKGGKQHAVPCHHRLERYLDEYITAAGLAATPEAPLFGSVHGRPLHQQDAYRMIQRRARAAGIATRIGNHSFRATGITAYLRNGGRLELAQQIANHESPRTTKLYDRRADEISLDEVERILI